MTRRNVLGVMVDIGSRREFEQRLHELATHASDSIVVTLNPEIVVAATRSTSYRDILNQANLAIPDGVGLVFASAFHGHRFPGVDIVSFLLAIADREHLRVGVVMPRHARSHPSHVRRQLTQMSPGAASIRIFSDHEMRELRNFSPQLLFVALGHPQQEFFLFEIRPHLPNLHLGIGCGGALDFFTGVALRAPTGVRRLGFEWMWRFVHEPWRAPRITRAVVVFPLLIVSAWMRSLFARFARNG